jgi:hypothetical protein
MLPLLYVAHYNGPFVYARRQRSTSTSVAVEPSIPLALPGPKFHVDFGYHISSNNQLDNVDHHNGGHVASKSECVNTDSQSSLSTRFIVDGKTVVIDEGLPLSNDIHDNDHLHTTRTAQRVWDCSIVLSSYLRSSMTAPTIGASIPPQNSEQLQQQQRPPQPQPHAHNHWLNGLRVVELGAGTGALVSITSSLLGAHVIATDLPAAIAAMTHNLQLNELPRYLTDIVSISYTLLSF